MFITHLILLSLSIDLSACPKKGLTKSVDLEIQNHFLNSNGKSMYCVVSQNDTFLFKTMLNSKV